MTDTLHGFTLDDLEAIADALEAGYEKTVNVGPTYDQHVDTHVESTTAAAARFIRTALAAGVPGTFLCRKPAIGPACEKQCEKCAADAAGVKECGTCKHKAQPLGYGPCRGCRYSGYPNWEAESAPGVPACQDCHGTGEVFSHADDCTDDLCALNGDEHSCTGKVERCACGVPASCAWEEEDPDSMPGTYRSACGELWAFTDGGVAENNVRFCQGCGKPVAVVPRPPEPSDEDEDGVKDLDHQVFDGQTPVVRVDGHA